MTNLLPSLLNNYDLLSTTRNEDDITIGDTKSIYCRFCKKTFPETTFNTISHLIPEMLGKNNTRIIDECDECNNKFSKYESHLNNFLAPYLSLIAAKGKKGYSSFTSRMDENDNRTIVQAQEFQRRIYFGSNTDDFKYDYEGKTLHINLRKQSYIPIYVYKSLMRIGLSLLPIENIEANHHYTNWLMSNDIDDLTKHPFLNCFFTHLGNKSFLNPWAELYKAKQVKNQDSECPEFILVVCSHNIVMQIFLPPSVINGKNHVKGSTLAIEVFPALMWQRFANQTEYSTKSIHLGSNQKVQENTWISFKYESINES